MSDARRYAVWPEPRSRSRSLKGSRPSVPHGTNFLNIKISHFRPSGISQFRMLQRRLSGRLSDPPQGSASSHSDQRQRWSRHKRTSWWCTVDDALDEHRCSVRTIWTLRLGKSSGTLRNFIMDTELYGTLGILLTQSDTLGETVLWRLDHLRFPFP